MTSSSPLVKVIFIWLGISTMLVMGGISFTDQISEGSFNTFVRTTGGNNGTWNPGSQQQYAIGNELAATGPNVNDQSTFSSGVNFIDALRAIRAFINLLIDVVLAIPTLFYFLPSAVQLLVGVPLGIAGLIGLVYFARSGT